MLGRGYGLADTIHLPYGKVQWQTDVETAMKLPVLLAARKLMAGRTTNSFSRRTAL
jgi:hypothetical protein